MVLHEFKCVFIHIPKTGGISIADKLGIPKEKQGHKSLKGFQSYKDDYFKFCFVRNPWDRFISCYFYFKKYGRKLGSDISSGKIINKFNDFDDFVNSFNKIRGISEPNFMDRFKSKTKEFNSSHFYNQMYWIDKKIDFIGRFENLQSDFNIVCDKIGIENKNLSWENKSKHKHYTEYYNDRTRKIVGKIYKKDIIYFGYKFGE